MIFQRKTWTWILFAGIVSASLYAVRDILLPFFAGFMIAYALRPAVDKIVSWGVNRRVAAVLMIFATFLVILGFFVVIIPFIVHELVKLAHNIPSYSERLFSVALPVLEKFSAYFAPADIQEIKTSLSEYLGNMIAWGLRFFARVLTNTLALANLISLIVLTPVTAFYMLLDWPKMMETIAELLPKKQVNNVQSLFHDINKNMGAYIRGQLMVCIILALFFSLALSLAGLNYAATLGLISGLLSCIPFIGTFISVSVSLGVAFAQQPEWWYLGVVGAIFAAGSVLENCIAPSLIGHSIGLHPVWIIFALLALGSLFGFPGMLVSMPIAAMLSVIVRFCVSQYKKSTLYLGVDQ